MILEEINTKWKELVGLGLSPLAVHLGPDEYLRAEMQINQYKKMDPEKVYALMESGTCQIESPGGRITMHLSGTPGIHFEFKRDDLPKIHNNWRARAAR